VPNTNLTDAQKQQVAAWIDEGLKLAEIQKRIESDFGLRLTYMEARFLLDDLKVMPRDPAPAPAPPSKLTAPAAVPQSAPTAPSPEPADLARDELPADQAPAPGAGSVRVGVDHIARPGAVVSGTVTFSDGQSGTWYLDEMGRLGLGMKTKGYRPAAADVEDFQMKLQQELARQGY
jgi:hypothetical protein